MRKALERYGSAAIAIVVLAVIAAVTGSYILLQQRLRTPFQDRYSLKAVLSDTSGLTPGLGQAVNVAGVRVGTISGVELEDGRSRVKMEIDPGKLPRVRANAEAILQPVTPGEDLTIELYPGRAPARVISPGGTIPASRTEAPVQYEELTAALDSDTRDFFDVLVSGLDQGTRGRGTDLRQLLHALGPTSAQLEQIGGALAGRRRVLERVVHNLRLVMRAAGEKDRDLSQLVGAANATLGALASEDVALQRSVARLPGTLSAARTSLRNTTSFANALGPTLRALLPTARKLPSTLRAARPLVDESVPILRGKLRPFVRQTVPLARDLRPAARDLNAQTPDLTSAFAVLQYVGNELGYNPPGDNEGFLHWTSWFFHNAASAVSTDDAHGTGGRGLLLTTCSTFTDVPALAPILQLITGPLPQCE